MTPSIELFNELRAEMERSSVPSRHGNDLNTKLVNSSGTVHIGRDRSRCQIVLADASGVSGLHLTISMDGSKVKVTDEHSSYGTWIDQQKLKPGQAVVMHRGQRLYLGSKKQAFLLRS